MPHNEIDATYDGVNNSDDLSFLEAAVKLLSHHTTFLSGDSEYYACVSKDHQRVAVKPRYGDLPARAHSSVASETGGIVDMEISFPSGEHEDVFYSLRIVNQNFDIYYKRDPKDLRDEK